MRALELFCGTKSVGKVLEDMGYDVISLDINEKCKPTFCCDIMDFDYKKYSVGEFAIIWASPECKIFSTLMNCWIGKKYANKDELTKDREKNGKYVDKTIEIIEYLKPQKWFIENPFFSKIKDVPCMTKILKNRNRFDYCRFGFDYQKPTAIWSNVDFDDAKCNCVVKRHKKTTTYLLNTNERYRIPPKLLTYLFTGGN